MTPSPDSFNPAPLRDALLTFLWRQWSALGVAGASRTGDNWVIDPEALLIFTAEQARRDPRLFDEVLAWVLLNESNLNLQRLASLLEMHPWGDTSVIGAIAATVAESRKSPRWRKLAERLRSPGDAPTLRALFLFEDGTAQPMPRDTDALFLPYGWARPAPQLRRLVVPVTPGRTETLLFTLRAFFGIQARAEIFAWLLANEGGRPADIARATGYKTRTVETTLADMTGSGQVLCVRMGRDKHYRIVRERWAFLLPGESPRWIDWAATFSAIARLLAVLDRPGMIHLLRASELKRAFDEVAAPLANAGLISLFTVTASEPTAQFAEKLLADLRRTLGGAAE